VYGHEVPLTLLKRIGFGAYLAEQVNDDVATSRPPFPNSINAERQSRLSVVLEQYACKHEISTAHLFRHIDSDTDALS
jgi:hypothetical protein